MIYKKTKNKMHNNTINEYCPNFMIGACKIVDCLYKFHNKCFKNLLCDNINCKYGHGVSYSKRIIIINTLKHLKKNEIINKCKFKINCLKVGCSLDHYIDYDDRCKINKLINCDNINMTLELSNKYIDDINDIANINDIDSITSTIDKNYEIEINKKYEINTNELRIYISKIRKNQFTIGVLIEDNKYYRRLIEKNKSNILKK